MAKKKVRKSKGKGKVKRRKKAPFRFRLSKDELIPMLGLLVMTLLIYARAFGYDFVNWDDDFNISENPNLRHLDWANVKGIFTSHVIGNYNPLPIFTFALEKHFFGLDPTVFHTTNVLLHVACVYVVYRFMRILDLPKWPALIAAAIFALHPMRVESVAWITERKDVLFGLFYVVALIQYVKWIKSGGKRIHYYWIIGAFVLSLFSKIQAVALPLSMLAVDYLLGRKLVWRRIIEKIPFFGLSLVFGLIGIYFLSQQGSLGSTTQYNFAERLVVGMYSLVIYLVKFFAPFRISPLYPYPPALTWYMFAAIPLTLVLAWVTWISWKRDWRALIFGGAFFVFNVMFVLQVVGAGQGFLADRFTYIPYIGLGFAVAFYGHQWFGNKGRLAQYAPWIAGVWIAALTFQTWQHVPVWKDSGTLWTHVLKYYENTPLPYRNRAQFLREQGDFAAALQDYDRSIQLKQNADVINSRARLHFTQENYQQALTDYNLAIQLDPQSGEFRINRGATYAVLGNLQNALADMTEGIRLDPSFTNGYLNRSLVYQRLNQMDNAHSDIQKYLEYNPYDADIWYENGRLFRLKKNEQEAINCFTRALGFADKGIYYLERSKAYLNTGQKSLAQSDLAAAERRGVQIDPNLRKSYQ